MGDRICLRITDGKRTTPTFYCHWCGLEALEIMNQVVQEPADSIGQMMCNFIVRIMRGRTHERSFDILNAGEGDSSADWDWGLWTFDAEKMEWSTAYPPLEGRAFSTDELWDLLNSSFRSLLVQEVPDEFDDLAAGCRISGSADLVDPFLAAGRPAEDGHDGEVVLLEDADHLLLLRETHGHQRRTADDVRTHLLRHPHEGVGIHIRPGVHHPEPRTAEHGAADVLPDRMHIPFHRPHDDDALQLGVPHHMGFDDIQGGLHGLRGHEDLREEYLRLVEILAYAVHAFGETVVDGRLRVYPLGHGGFRVPPAVLHVPGGYGILQSPEYLLPVHPSSSDEKRGLPGGPPPVSDHSFFSEESISSFCFLRSAIFSSDFLIFS